MQNDGPTFANSLNKLSTSLIDSKP